MRKEFTEGYVLSTVINFERSRVLLKIHVFKIATHCEGIVHVLLAVNGEKREMTLQWDRAL